MNNMSSENHSGLYTSQVTESYLRFPATASPCPDWWPYQAEAVHTKTMCWGDVRRCVWPCVIIMLQAAQNFLIVIVDKKDGSKRFCTDLRKLNLISKKSSWPLPVIDDMLVVLGKAEFFTILNLKSGYWQITIDENNNEKTAFTCHRGFHEYNVMPFEFTNAPDIFQELMSIVFQDLDNFAMAYLDDIIIFSSSIQEHKRHIQIVFDRLRQHQLKLKLPKFKFLQKETQYLGFIISKSGIMTYPDKVHVIRNMVPPKCVREVRSFIGMCNYHRRFI